MRTYLGKLFLQKKLLENLNSQFKRIKEQNPKPEFSRATLLDPFCKKLVFQNITDAENVELSLLISEILIGNK